jgi:hypothetical protein
MNTAVVAGEWGVTPGRSCGTCNACCIYLGIDELKKWPGTRCRHLSRAADPAKQCRIYADRPHTCSQYVCVWREGWGPEWLRPQDSGLLITSHRDPAAKPGEPFILFTLVVFDPDKATNEIIRKVTGEIISGFHSVREIRVFSEATKAGFLYVNGFVYRMQVLPGDTYEQLKYRIDSQPIGRYLTSEKTA